MNWFEVDKIGLSKIMSRKPKYFILYELLQNSWDENSTIVNLSLTREKNSKFVDITIEDNNPDGFKDLKNSFTLFAESDKKSNPSKRGRFNLGEKLVLSLCSEAKITSTTGTVIFNKDGRKKSKSRLEKGTIFKAKIMMTQSEVMEATESISSLIPPNDIKTYFNGVRIVDKTPIKTFNYTLPTEISDADGFIKKTKRKTDIEIYDDGKSGWIYEMGIPVVETGDKYHINILQKVPLNIERDNVSPSYLKLIRSAVLEQTINLISIDEISQNWINDALGSKDINQETVKGVISKKYGDKVVIFDPSDPEANKIAISKGYNVIHGRQLNKEQWSNIKDSGLMKPAGQVTPSAKPFSDDENASPLKVVNRSDWSETEIDMVDKVIKLSKDLIGKDINVKIANDISWRFQGSFSKGNLTMILNKAVIGKKWFEGLSMKSLPLIIHELGHYYSSDHLSSDYYDGLCELGTKLAFIDIEKY